MSVCATALKLVVLVVPGVGRSREGRFSLVEKPIPMVKIHTSVNCLLPRGTGISTRIPFQKRPSWASLSVRVWPDEGDFVNPQLTK